MSAFTPSASPVDDTLCDFWVPSEGGNLFILIPKTEAANAWVDEYLPEDVTLWGRGIVVEHRYILDIVEGIRGCGLAVE